MAAVISSADRSLTVDLGSRGLLALLRVAQRSNATKLSERLRRMSTGIPHHHLRATIHGEWESDLALSPTGHDSGLATILGPGPVSEACSATRKGVLPKPDMLRRLSPPGRAGQSESRKGKERTAVRGEHQITGRKESVGLRQGLATEGAMLAPVVELIEAGQPAVEELVGQATLEAVPAMSAEQVALDRAGGAIRRQSRARR